MKFRNNIKWRKWLRIIHRDLGYFIVGITVVYSVSGIILNHKRVNNDPAYKTISHESNIEKMLTSNEIKFYLGENFNDVFLKKILYTDSRFELILDGGIGFYEPETGLLFFETYRKKPFVFFINKLHYNQKKHWTTPADFYAISLIFLALSGLVMVRGKNGFMKRGIWFVAGGIVLVIIYIWL
jgi:hypothetical protein